MKKSIFLIFGLMLAVNLAYATEDAADMNDLQTYSDAVNDAVVDGDEATDDEVVTESPVSPYGIQSARIAQLLDERDGEEDSEEELQQQYASMHDDDLEEDTTSL